MATFKKGEIERTDKISARVKAQPKSWNRGLIGSQSKIEVIVSTG